MPLQLRTTYTHHPADTDITGAALWLPVRGGSLADPGSVCSMLTSFQVSSGEKEMLERNGSQATWATFVQCQSERDMFCGLTGKHCPGSAERASRQALGGTG